MAIKSQVNNPFLFGVRLYRDCGINLYLIEFIYQLLLGHITGLCAFIRIPVI